MARSNRWKKSFFVHFIFGGWLCSYWPSYPHCQHAPCDGYNLRQLPALSHSRVHCDNCLLWVDRECFSGGTRLSCPSTPQPSCHPWSLLECRHVSISVSWVGGPWACPFYGSLTVPQQKIFFWAKLSYRSGEGKKLYMYSLWPSPSTPLVRLATVLCVAVRCCAALCLSLPR